MATIIGKVLVEENDFAMVGAEGVLSFARFIDSQQARGYRVEVPFLEDIFNYKIYRDETPEEVTERLRVERAAKQKKAELLKAEIARKQKQLKELTKGV